MDFIEYFKYLMAMKTISFEDKNDNEITIKYPVYIRLLVYFQNELQSIYIKIWNLLPFYSSKWFDKFYPSIPIVQWWIDKQLRKYNAYTPSHRI